VIHYPCSRVVQTELCHLHWHQGRSSVPLADALNLTLDGMHDIFRSFSIPGIENCSGGVGQWSIRQPGVNRLMGAQFNPSQRSVLLALVDWVEQGSQSTINRTEVSPRAK
jgi:hypothetical protein